MDGISKMSNDFKYFLTGSNFLIPPYRRLCFFYNPGVGLPTRVLHHFALKTSILNFSFCTLEVVLTLTSSGYLFIW